MDVNLKQRIDYELMILEDAKEKYTARRELLRDCKGAVLRRSRKKNHNYHYYYIKRPGSSGFSYLGNERTPEVGRVREMRFLNEAIGRIDHNIALLKGLADGFLSFDPSSVNEALPAIYRCEVPPVSKLYEHEGKKWLIRRLEDQKLFPENYPERKSQRTSDGVMVKTISEVTLYEMCKAAGFYQIYELPIPMKDYGPPLYPDLTILSPVDMKTEIIVEYVGRLDLREYREAFARKVGRYIACGYTPGVDLFFVFSKNDGHIDAMQITKVIAKIKGLRRAEAC